VVKKSDIQRDIDSSRLITRMSAASGAVALVMLVLTEVLYAFRGGDVFILGSIPYALALLFSVGALFYGVLKTAAALDEEEKALLAKRADTRALDVEEDVRFTAGRSFENYRRFAPYAISVLALLIVGWLLYRSWGELSGRQFSSLHGDAVHSALISAVMMLLSVFSGAFFVGQSRTEGFRWLRPAGAWLIAGFAVMTVATVTAICFGNNLVRIDTLLARIVFWILAVLGVELIVNMIIEFYRPRTLKETRPVFESQLLALFTEPGGVMRNVALALDYQFGFKVSGTWLYGFLERSFFPVLLVWLVLLWGFTSLHEVGPSEVGVKERLGRVVSAKPLPPGIYWTLPWPFGGVNRYSCTELRQIVIGEMASAPEKEKSAAPDDGHGHSDAADKSKDDKKKPSQVVTWTSAHGADDENFIVAVKGGGDSETASISFLRMSIPIQFRIRPDGVMNFAYGNVAPVFTLKCISEAVATEYLASVSMMEVMSTSRGDAEKTMRDRIQARADECGLGLDIVSVTITGAHPPIERVAPAFQDVIGAMEQKETSVLEAEAYQAQTLPEAEAAALELKELASAYSFTTRTVAAAESQRFKAQLATFRAMPGMFKLRAFLDFLEKDCADMRKFVLTTKSDADVFQFNFEVKERLDLIDTDVTKIKY
jgi:regulator of protease activity HflC (stomatin/prohibitin superfamily)